MASFKENIPVGSKLNAWLDTSDLNGSNSPDSPDIKTVKQPNNQQTRYTQSIPTNVISIPPFMYTIMVSLIWECKTNHENINHLHKVIVQFTKLFHQEKLKSEQIKINNQLILYNNQLIKLCEKTIATKIKLLAAQAVIKKISIADHKDLLVKAAKHYAALAKHNPWISWFKEVNQVISLEIKYVNHYEFHEMETFPL